MTCVFCEKVAHYFEVVFYVLNYLRSCFDEYGAGHYSDNCSATIWDRCKAQQLLPLALPFNMVSKLHFESGGETFLVCSLVKEALIWCRVASLSLVRIFKNYHKPSSSKICWFNYVNTRTKLQCTLYSVQCTHTQLNTFKQFDLQYI